MTTTAITEEEYVQLQAKKEELEGDFHLWMQSHFDKDGVVYLNELVNLISDEDFLVVAEKWALNTKKPKIFY